MKASFIHCIHRRTRSRAWVSEQCRANTTKIPSRPLPPPLEDVQNWRLWHLPTQRRYWSFWATRSSSEDTRIPSRVGRNWFCPFTAPKHQRSHHYDCGECWTQVTGSMYHLWVFDWGVRKILDRKDITLHTPIEEAVKEEFVAELKRFLSSFLPACIRFITSCICSLILYIHGANALHGPERVPTFDQWQNQ